jgi:translation initiation factor 2A
MRIWSLTTGEEVASFTQKAQEGWDVQYTASESHALRLSGTDIQVYNPSDWAAGIVEKLKVEGCSSFSLSPGANPSVAVFVPEKKVRLSLLIAKRGPLG